MEENFYPKLYNFNFNDHQDYLAMTLIGLDLKKIIKFTEKNILTVRLFEISAFKL